MVHFPYVERSLEQRYQEVFVWDLDKTYLDTRIDSLSGLFETVLEKPFQKRNVPGTAVLLKQIRTNALVRFKIDRVPIYFITASPPQMEANILQKLRLDGIQPFGLFCKDNLKNLRPGRLWRLTQQVGYKLQALLQLRLHLAEDVRQIMWGDDSESDVLIYCLYSDICSRRMDENAIRSTLRGLKVMGQQTDEILSLQEQIPKQDPVSRIYINLAEDTDAEYYQKFGRRTVPTYNSFQTALDLCQEDRITPEQVVVVAQDLALNFGFSRDEVEKSLDDLIRRQILSEQFVPTMVSVLKAHGVISESFEPSVAPQVATHEPWVPDRIDYLHDYR